MSDMCETDINLPMPNFTEDNALSNNPTQYSDFSRNVNKSRKRRRQFNFLNNNNNQCLNSRVSVVDITGNNDQFVNRRIPIIDLTNEVVMDITGQIQCIDLTNECSSRNNNLNRHLELKRKLDSSSNRYSDCQFEPTRNDDSSSATHPKRHLDLTRNDNSSNNIHRNHHFELKSNGNSSSNSPAINHFELTRNDDSSSNSQPLHHFELPGNNDFPRNSQPNHTFDLNKNGSAIDQCSERFNFANQDGRTFITNEPVRNLTCYNDDFANYRFPGMKHMNGQNIAHQLQLTSLRNAKQQCNVNDSIPPTNLGYDIGQHIEQNIPPIQVTSRVNYPNYRQPIFDPPTDNADDIVPNAESLNLTQKFTQSSNTIQDGEVVRKPIDISEMYGAELNSSNNLHTNCSKRATEINLRIPVETPRYGKTELNILKSKETQNMHFTQMSSMQQHQCKKEIISKNSHPQATCYHQKDLRPGINWRISEMNTLDLLKPASHPVLFRHSLGRSTVNTSKNVPIESTGVPKSRSQSTTVSSTLRRKKAKSIGDIPKQIQPNSLINFRSQIPAQTHFPLEMLKNVF